MTTLKLIVSVVVCCMFLQTATAQKISSHSSSVSQKISTGATDAEVLQLWEDYLLQKEVKTYAEAQKLVDQTMQLAFLHGNRRLGASITKTAYYLTLNSALTKEINTIKTAIAKNQNATQKKYKMDPNARDMQRLAGIGNIDLASQRQLRTNLIAKAEEIQASTQNESKPTLPDVFSTSDVLLSSGSEIITKEALNTYLNQLITAQKDTNNKLSQSKKQLQAITTVQQQIAKNEKALTKKMLTKASTLIN